MLTINFINIRPFIFCSIDKIQPNNKIECLKFCSTAKLPRGYDPGVSFGLYLKGHALTRRMLFKWRVERLWNTWIDSVIGVHRRRDDLVRPNENIAALLLSCTSLNAGGRMWCKGHRHLNHPSRTRRQTGLLLSSSCRRIDFLSVVQTLNF